MRVYYLLFFTVNMCSNGILSGSPIALTVWGLTLAPKCETPQKRFGWTSSESSTVWINEAFSKKPRIRDHQHHIIIIIINSNRTTHSHTETNAHTAAGTVPF